MDELCNRVLYPKSVSGSNRKTIFCTFLSGLADEINIQTYDFDTNNWYGLMTVSLAPKRYVSSILLNRELFVMGGTANDYSSADVSL